VRTFDVDKDIEAAISARAVETSRTATLRVTPPPPPVRLASFSVHPATLAAGDSTEGAVLLSDAAASKGATIQLASGDPELVSVPPRVTIPAGQRTLSSRIRTGRTTSTRSIAVTAMLGEARKATTLTLNPIAVITPLPPPALASPAEFGAFRTDDQVAFDWSEVAGARSYTLEVDDSREFLPAIVVNRTVPASHTTVTPFSAGTLWWRVRSNDANGAPGPWSLPRQLIIH
jgi:hypothetical protein